MNTPTSVTVHAPFLPKNQVDSITPMTYLIIQASKATFKLEQCHWIQLIMEMFRVQISESSMDFLKLTIPTCF